MDNWICGLNLNLFQEKTKGQLKNCSVHHLLVEGLEVVPELHGKITLKILIGLALAFHASILRGGGPKCLKVSTKAAAPLTPPRRISESRKVSCFSTSIALRKRCLRLVYSLITRGGSRGGRLGLSPHPLNA